jgi:hypothetical protein
MNFNEVAGCCSAGSAGEGVVKITAKLRPLPGAVAQMYAPTVAGRIQGEVRNARIEDRSAHKLGQPTGRPELVVDWYFGGNDRLTSTKRVRLMMSRS